MAKLSAAPILVVLAMLFAQYNCQTSAANARQCMGRIERCRDLLSTMPLSSGAQQLGTLCGRRERIMSCLRECITAPTMQASVQGAVVQILDFICDPSRRAEMERLVAAPCFQDSGLQAQVNIYSQQCVQQTMQNARPRIMQAVMAGRDMASVMCPALRDSTRCAANRIGEHCGDFVVEPINELVTILYRHMLPQYSSCMTSVAHVPRIYKRAAEVVFEYLRR